MKKIIICLTIFSMLNLVGCYYQQQMTPEEYTFDENLDLHVTTKDTAYNILGEDYYYKNDTLFVKVPIQLDKHTSAKLKVNIPTEAIDKIEVKRVDALDTALTIGAVVVVAAGILFLIGLASFGSGWN
jgi:hypothetical protein